MHVPVVNIVTVNPETVQTLGVDDDIVTIRVELDEAITVNGDTEYARSSRSANEMVCTESTAEGTVVGVDSAVIRNDRVTAVAAR